MIVFDAGGKLCTRPREREGTHAGAQRPSAVALGADEPAKWRSAVRTRKALLDPRELPSAALTQKIARKIADHTARGPHELLRRLKCTAEQLGHINHNRSPQT